MATLSYETESAGVKVTNVIFFDATMSESHTGAAEVTEHEVERGADLADHVRPSRPALSLEVMVTNTPTQSVGRLQGAFIPTLMTAPLKVQEHSPPRPKVQAQVIPGFIQPGPKLPGFPRYYREGSVIPGDIGNFPPGSFMASVFTFPNPRDRLVDLWEALNRLREEATILHVVTRLQEYDSMLITNITAPVAAMDAITFGLQFKQIGFSESLTFSQVDQVKRVAVKKAQPKKEEGPKDPYTLDQNSMRSVWIRGIRGIFGFKEPNEFLNPNGGPTVPGA